MSLRSVDVLAIHDAYLARMQFQSTLPKPFIDPSQDELRLRLAFAMDHAIVSVAAETTWIQPTQQLMGRSSYRSSTHITITHVIFRC
jgi:hypothetical protein